MSNIPLKSLIQEIKSRKVFLFPSSLKNNFIFMKIFTNFEWAQNKIDFDFNQNF